MRAVGWGTLRFTRPRLAIAKLFLLNSDTGGISGGQREYVAPLAHAALAAGANGVFLETHPNPDKAITDAASQVPLDELPELVESLLRVWTAIR